MAVVRSNRSFLRPVSGQSDVRKWPRVPVRGLRRQLTLAGLARASKVRFLARSRTHVARQFQSSGWPESCHSNDRFRSNSRHRPTAAQRGAFSESVARGLAAPVEGPMRSVGPKFDRPNLHCRPDAVQRRGAQNDGVQYRSSAAGRSTPAAVCRLGAQPVRGRRKALRCAWPLKITAAIPSAQTPPTQCS